MCYCCFALGIPIFGYYNHVHHNAATMDGAFNFWLSDPLMSSLVKKGLLDNTIDPLITPEPTPNATPEHSEYPPTCSVLFEPLLSSSANVHSVHKEMQLFDSPASSDNEDYESRTWIWCEDFMSAARDRFGEVTVGRALQQLNDLKTKSTPKSSDEASQDVKPAISHDPEAARKQRLMESPLHDWRDSELAELDDDFMEDYKDLSQMENPFEYSDGYDSSGRVLDTKPPSAGIRTVKRAGKRVGRPRKSPKQVPVYQASVSVADINDHDYCSQRPAVAPVRVSRSPPAEQFAVPSQVPGSSSTSVAAAKRRLVTVGRQPAKGGRKPKDGGAVRDPVKREQHRIAERNRRQVHKQLFDGLVTAIVSVKPNAYMDFNNKKSKKNNLTVALQILENQEVDIRKKCNTLVRRLWDLCELLGARVQESPRSMKMPQDLKEVREMISEVNRLRSKFLSP